MSIKSVTSILTAVTLATLAAALPAQDATPVADDASVYFITPQDGDVVSSPVTVRFGLSGAGVAPAGIIIDNTGHHHLIVNAPLPPLDQPVPADDNHRHFGKGQTETAIELPPGQHTLQLLLGDALHKPHSRPIYSDQIGITVE